MFVYICLSLSNWTEGAHRAPCARYAKSRLFSTTAGHGFQGPEFRIPRCFKLIMHPSVGGWFSGVFPG